MLCVVYKWRRVRDRGPHPDVCAQHNDAHAKQQHHNDTHAKCRHYNDAYAEQQHYNDACALHYDIWSGTEHHIDHNGECFDNQYSTRAMCVIMCCNVRNVCVFCSRHADVP